MKQKPMFEQMANDIACWIVAVHNDYGRRIKKRKCSKHIVNYWIYEAANIAVKKIEKRSKQ